MTYSINDTFELNDGNEIPIFGLGLYQAEPEETINAVQWAFDAGYRMFDTAQIYGNENEVGDALEKLDVDREEIFVTTKLWNDNHGNDLVPSLHESLDKLGLDYVDLFLMHWPVKEHRLESWGRMINLREEGLTKPIGVSNFLINHMDELLDYTNVLPAINQVEYSPYLNRKELKHYCHSKDIRIEGYSPLTKAEKLDDTKLVEMAKKYDKSPAQILIRWGIQQDIVTIPKSTNKGRIEENSEVFDFDLSKDDLIEMRDWDEGLVTGWDPSKQE